MREMSSEVRHKRRHRSPSYSSPEGNRKVSYKVNNSETTASRHEKKTTKQSKCKYSQKVHSEDTTDSSFEHVNDRNLGKKKKKHSHHHRVDPREVVSEDENYATSKRRTSQPSRDDGQRSKTDGDKSRPRETEDSRCNHGKEQHLSSEYRSSDHTRRRERYHEEDGGHKRDSGGRHGDRRVVSSDSEKRVHSNDRNQDNRGEGHNRRRNADENDRREGNRRMQEGEERRKQNDGGEGSRSGGSRGHGSREGKQLTNFDRNRPIKQEPGVNNDESENYEWGSRAAGGPKSGNNTKKEKDVEKDKPNFGLSGKLTEDTNMVNGVVIKYSEPPEARKPRRRWRLYVFKGEENLPTLYLHRQSAFLIGRDRKVCDIPVDHPSCSKQHAAFQFRLVPYQRPNGTMGKRVRPYIIDLESSNGTYVNNNRIDPKKYVELLERDVVKFGYSSREYVLLHEQSKESDGDDDDVAGT